MLDYYGKHFRAVEINSTFRVMPTASVLQEWADKVSAKFQFAIKAPQQITHFKRLKGCGELVSRLLEVTRVLGKRQGPLLFQLRDNFKKDAPRLAEFLKLLPRKRRAAFEFRHPSWFDDETFDLLRDHQAALCIADETDELKVPFEATADWGYLRLRRTEYTTAALKKWVKGVQKQVWNDTFVFFKHEDEAKGPQFARKFLELAAQ
jgi:uncharacterized protein YecE (DUF72 family)